MMKWISRLFRPKNRLSDQWLYEQAQKETCEGWEGPRWRFPAEVAEQNRLERKRRISMVRTKLAEEKDQRRA